MASPADSSGPGSPARSPKKKARQLSDEDKLLQAAQKTSKLRKGLPGSADGNSIGVKGLRRGATAQSFEATPGAARRPIVIRSLRHVEPLLTHESIAGAMKCLAGGGDIHRARSALNHGDTISVHALIKAWYQRWGLVVPPTFAGADTGDLSAEARARVEARMDQALPVPFVIEDVGFDDKSEEPLLPLDWVGRRFEDGSALEAELGKILVEDESDPQWNARRVTFSLSHAPEESWLDSGAAERMLEACELKPAVCIRVIWDGGQHVEVSFREKPQEQQGQQEQQEQKQDLVHRVVAGLTATVLLSVTPTLVDESQRGKLETSAMDLDSIVPSPTGLSAGAAAAEAGEAGVEESGGGKAEEEEEEEEEDQKPSSREAEGRKRGLFARPSASAKDVAVPASLLQKAIRRGATLCSASLVEEACGRLLTTKSLHNSADAHFKAVTGLRTLLWRLFMATLEDVRPYASVPGGEDHVALDALLGLLLISHVDTSFTLPSNLRDPIISLARKLHSYDEPAATWPWRGWRTFVQAADYSFEFEALEPAGRVRNALRAAAQLCSKGDERIIQRHLGALAQRPWVKRLQPLPQLDLEEPVDPIESMEQDEAHRFLALDKEVRLSAFDLALRPAIIVWVQASMPFAPRSSHQHSLRALGDLMWRLDSSLNARAMRQQLLGGPAEELFRIQQFAEGGDDDDEEEEVARTETPERPIWGSSLEGLRNLTPHEKALLGTIKAVQRQVQGTFGEQDEPQEQLTDHLARSGTATKSAAQGPTGKKRKRKLQASGRPPSTYESRVAFLQLFGKTHRRTLQGNMPVAITTAGTAETPILVQSLAEDKAASNDENRPRPYAYQRSGKLWETAIEEWVPATWDIQVPPPPQGFAWDLPGTVNLQVRRNLVKTEEADVGLGGIDWGSDVEEDTPPPFSFFVNGTEVAAFDASALLVPNNTPAVQRELSPQVRSLVERGLYATKEESDDVDSFILQELDSAATTMVQEDLEMDTVHLWSAIAERSRLSKFVWRDLVVKIETRENDEVIIAPVSQSGDRAQQATKQLTEGTLLRCLLCFSVLYPQNIQRTDAFRFTVNSVGAGFTHLLKQLHLLAFGSFDDGVTFLGCEAEAGTKSDPIPSLTTALWEHQHHAVETVKKKLVAGQRGFADASSVGSGKTLTALATCQRVAEWLEMKQMKRLGFLVLVPSNDLIAEWEQQLLTHTKGFDILVQKKCGSLSRKGGGRGQGSTPQINGNSIVLTTLARCRDHNFMNHEGWDFVVIDECLSVQNDTALQTAEAWRQIISSRCGVHMLSATFFRSRFSKLWYMVRMLKSALPRTEAYLNALLTEHIICFIPENRRSWKLNFHSVPVTGLKHYHDLIDGHIRAGRRDHRALYTQLKGWLRDQFEAMSLAKAVACEVERLQAKGCRVLIFCNSDNEMNHIILPGLAAAGLPCRTWNAKQGSASGEEGPLVVTVHRASHGLNLQGEADVIICRPQPGDVIEQMKGRIDRPGQVKTSLELFVIFAEQTIEEAEAANIKLCGRFFRQYLDPLSIPFIHTAVEAQIASRSAAEAATGSGPARSGSSRGVKGNVASAFVKTLRAGNFVQSDDRDTAAAAAVGSTAAMTDETLAPSETDIQEAMDVTLSTDAGISTVAATPPTPAAAAAAAAGVGATVDSKPATGKRKASESASTTSSTPSQGKSRKKADPGKRKGPSSSDPALARLSKFFRGTGGDKGGKKGASSAAAASSSSASASASHSEDPASSSSSVSGLASEPSDGGKKRKSSSSSAASPESEPAIEGQSKETKGSKGIKGEKETKEVKVKSPKKSKIASTTSTGPVVTLPSLDMPAILAVLSKQDPKLGAVIGQIGPPTALITRLGGEPFLALCKSICYQQLSTIAAAAIFGRMVEAAGGQASFGPAAILATAPEALKKAGLSSKKVEYVKALADEFESGRLSREILQDKNDAEVLATLCSIRGIGEWSAHMFMMFSLGRADVLPVGDIAVRKAFRRLYGVTQNMAEKSETSVAEHQDLPNRKQMEALTECWKPYRTIGSWYMWHVVETSSAFYTY